MSRILTVSVACIPLWAITALTIGLGTTPAARAGDPTFAAPMFPESEVERGEHSHIDEKVGILPKDPPIFPGGSDELLRDRVNLRTTPEPSTLALLAVGAAALLRRRRDRD